MHPFTLIIPAAAAQSTTSEYQPLPCFDGSGWQVQTSTLPIRYPIPGLQVGDVITGWRLVLWREDEGPNSAAVLEWIDEEPGNEHLCHEPIQSSVNATGPAPLSIAGLSVPVTAGMTVSLCGNGIAGDRALTLFVHGLRPEPNE